MTREGSAFAPFTPSDVDPLPLHEVPRQADTRFLIVQRAHRKAGIEKAQKAVETLMQNPNARYKVQAWMEKNFIYEELADWALQAKKEKKEFNETHTKYYRGAFTEWEAFMKQPSITGANLQQRPVQEIYFSGYFYAARIRFKLGAFDPEIKDRQRLINGAANSIYRLETAKQKIGWEIAGPMFMELLKDKEYDQLKKAYEALKKGSSLSPPRREWQNARAGETSPGGTEAISQGRQPLELATPSPEPRRGESDRPCLRATVALPGLGEMVGHPPGACAPGYWLTPLRG